MIIYKRSSPRSKHVRSNPTILYHRLFSFSSDHKAKNLIHRRIGRNLDDSRPSHNHAVCQRSAGAVGVGDKHVALALNTHRHWCHDRVVHRLHHDALDREAADKGEVLVSHQMALSSKCGVLAHGKWSSIGRGEGWEGHEWKRHVFCRAGNDEGCGKGEDGVGVERGVEGIGLGYETTCVALEGRV